MSWNSYITPVIPVIVLVCATQAPLAYGEEPALTEQTTADMQGEFRALRAEMKKMKRVYDVKIAEMEEKLEIIREEKERENWGKLQTMPYLRQAADKGNMTAEERAKIEREAKELMGEELLGPKEGLAYQPLAEEAPGNLFDRQVMTGGIPQTYNPDISVIGDFLGTFINHGEGLLFEDGGFEDNEFADRFAFRETELTLQSVIDPYARADFILSMEDAREFAIEEATLTLLTLPYGIQSKAGIFKAAFGKINRTHRPELPQVDYPNVVKNLLGPEGLNMTGLSISWLVPNPWDRWIELTGEVSTPTARDKMFLAHLKTFHELTPNSMLQAGLTGATGVLPEGLLADNQRRVNMEGFDLTYRWKPVTERHKPYRSFLWQAEVIASQPHDSSLENAWGGYTFGEYQLTRRNYLGLRLDYSQFLTANKGDYEWAISPYWTLWQSDFTRYRLTYSHTQRHITQGPSSDDSIMLQATFSIGVHRPHPF
ncbi:MAG: hypothetical protein V3V45_07370 [Candidatus Brocadiales bacterium]